MTSIRPLRRKKIILNQLHNSKNWPYLSLEIPLLSNRMFRPFPIYQKFPLTHLPRHLLRNSLSFHKTSHPFCCEPSTKTLITAANFCFLKPSTYLKWQTNKQTNNIYTTCKLIIPNTLLCIHSPDERVMPQDYRYPRYWIQPRYSVPFHVDRNDSLIRSAGRKVKPD